MTSTITDELDGTLQALRDAVAALRADLADNVRVQDPQGVLTRLVVAFDVVDAAATCGQLPSAWQWRPGSGPVPLSPQMRQTIDTFAARRAVDAGRVSAALPRRSPGASGRR
jgi:hypothetical protein